MGLREHLGGGAALGEFRCLVMGFESLHRRGKNEIVIGKNEMSSSCVT